MKKSFIVVVMILGVLTLSSFFANAQTQEQKCLDIDNDTVCHNTDNCKLISNSDQKDTDGDGMGNACDQFPTTRKTTLQNLQYTCGDLIAPDFDVCGLIAKGVSHTFIPNTSTDIYIEKFTNPTSVTKTMKYEWFGCRCDEKNGNPNGICLEYIPFINYTDTNPSLKNKLNNCLSFGNQTITLAPGETKNLSVNVSQYRNQICGTIQMDLYVHEVNGYNGCEGLKGYSLTFLCKDCPAPKCGDGILDTNEQCDDGNKINSDSCRNDCTIPICGDGIKDAGEFCDDGNKNNSDSCRNDCSIPICGDGIKDTNEQCDDGNQINTDGCKNDCTLCPDQDKDGICDPDDDCPDSNLNETVDMVGCDPFQFCKPRICGYSCDFADWKNNEIGGLTAALLHRNPRDCMTILVDHEGQVTPKCVPSLCAN